METDPFTNLRSDVASLRQDVTCIRHDIGTLEAKADSIEAWRVRYLVQEDQLIGKLFNKIEELGKSLSDMKADLARIRGEREAERRTSLTVVSLLSAACGGLIASLIHG